jgi:hypothetical protein
MTKARIQADAVAFYQKIEAAASSLSRANLSGVIGARGSYTTYTLKGENGNVA